MESVIFRLKDPQKGTTASKQKDTLIFMYFSYGYYETTLEGKKKYIPLKYSTGIKIHPSLWNFEGNNKYRIKNTKKLDYANLNTDLENLEALVKQVYRKNKIASPSRLREILNMRLDKTIQDVISLNLYINKYFIEISNGIRLTNKGKKYKDSTIKTFKGFISIFNKFQKHKNRKYDYNDITIDFYNDFTAFLTSLNYSPNTIGRHVKSIKIIMHEARNEGHHNNTEIDNKAFKVLTMKVENIYLTENELQRMYKLDLSKKPHLEQARDVFLVGCYTAQRFSDYSRINKNHLLNGYIELIQKKTQEKVIIPIRPELEAILSKYNYTLPKTYEQKVNKNIKEVGMLAGINETIQTENTRGGLIIKKDVPKYMLIKTHTARRTGASNMHNAKIPSIDIMKITGHKTETEFLKYINLSKKETAEKLSIHPYYNTPILKVK